MVAQASPIRSPNARAMEDATLLFAAGLPSSSARSVPSPAARDWDLPTEQMDCLPAGLQFCGACVAFLRPASHR